ncbi:MAG: hypothetical protein AB7L84_04935 [Acidimicrobiia bacterium]
MAAIEAEASPIAGEEVLDGPDRVLEALQLAVRTRWGVPAWALGEDELPGLVEADGERWRLTVQGRLLANEVALRLRVPEGAPATVAQVSGSTTISPG